jgi:hypothetical protein
MSNPNGEPVEVGRGELVFEGGFNMAEIRPSKSKVDELAICEVEVFVGGLKTAETKALKSKVDVVGEALADEPVAVALGGLNTPEIKALKSKVEVVDEAVAEEALAVFVVGLTRPFKLNVDVAVEVVVGFKVGLKNPFKSNVLARGGSPKLKVGIPCVLDAANFKVIDKVRV